MGKAEARVTRHNDLAADRERVHAATHDTEVNRGNILASNEVGVSCLTLLPHGNLWLLPLPLLNVSEGAHRLLCKEYEMLLAGAPAQHCKTRGLKGRAKQLCLLALVAEHGFVRCALRELARAEHAQNLETQRLHHAAPENLHFPLLSTEGEPGHAVELLRREKSRVDFLTGEHGPLRTLHGLGDHGLQLITLGSELQGQAFVRRLGRGCNEAHTLAAEALCFRDKGAEIDALPQQWTGRRELRTVGAGPEFRRSPHVPLLPWQRRTVRRRLPNALDSGRAARRRLPNALGSGGARGVGLLEAGHCSLALMSLLALMFLVELGGQALIAGPLKDR